MGEFIKKFPKEEFLAFISNGLLEDEALAAINEGKRPLDQMPKGTFIQLQLKDPEFKDALDRAKKERADVWFGDIAKSVRKSLSKEEVAAEKLKFEQRRYLAAIDNPDKYAEKSKKEIDVNVNIFQEMKELPVHEARKLLQSVDPFNLPIETEFQSIPQNEENSQNDITVQSEELEDLLS